MIKEIIKGAVYMISGAVILAAIWSADTMSERKAHFDSKMQGKQNIRINIGDDVKHGLQQHHLHGEDGKIIWQKQADTISLPVVPQEEIEVEVPEAIEEVRG